MPEIGSNIVAIIDDDGDVREVLEALLEAAGHTVKTYTSAQRLLDAPEIGDITCLVVDQRMPGMTGLELLRELDARGCAIPSLLISGLPDADMAREARAVGAIAVLTKPLDVKQLLRLISYAAV